MHPAIQQARGARALPAVLVAVAAIHAPAAAAPFLPDFGAAMFVSGAPVDNTYLPLVPGSRTVQVAEVEDDGEIVEERSELTVLGPGPTILGVQSIVQLDRAFEGGLLVEETYDYYAQDTAGNVWYLGEDVTNFRRDDDGNLISTDSASAWLAGENGALPGFIMLASPEVGFNYYQEFAPADEALDQATILTLDAALDLGFASFDDVLVTFETSELDPDAREFKYYAPGIGVIAADEGLDESLMNPAARFRAVSVGPAPVPLPAGLPLLLAALAGLWLLGARRAPA